jgi:hypothetical protein
MLAVWCGLCSARADWVAYVDHLRGGATSNNTLVVNWLGSPSGTNWALTNIATGLAISNGQANVGLVMTKNGSQLDGGLTMGTPTNGTPAWNLFSNYCSWNASAGSKGVFLRGTNGASYTLTFTNLDPLKRYDLRATVVRGGTYTNRWTVASLQDADWFDVAHTAGCYTNNDGRWANNPPNSLTNGQVLLNCGAAQMTNGDVVGWTNIAVGSDGRLALEGRQWTAVCPNGAAADTNFYAFMFTAIRLAEYSLPEGPPQITTPMQDQTNLPGLMVRFTVGTVGTQPLWYYWFTNDVFLFTNLTPSVSQTLADEGSNFQCRVIVSNSLGTATNSAAAWGAYPPLLAVLTNPAAGQELKAGQALTLGATASGGKVPLTVEFFTNDVSCFLDDSPPYQTTVVYGIPTTVRVYARATDVRNVFVCTATNTLTVTNTPPTVTLVSPANGAKFTPGVAIGLVGRASDMDGAVTNLSFSTNGAWLMDLPNVGEDVYSNQWASVPAGVYALRAVATDNLGLSSTSAAVTLTVAEPLVQRGPYLGSRGETNIIVRWRTDLAHVGRVWFGTNAGSLDQFADDTASRTNHSVALVGLQPETKYYYSVGTPSRATRGGLDCCFKTAPPIGQSRLTRIWYTSDMGTASAYQVGAYNNAYTNWLAPEPADLWITTGDNDQTQSPDGGSDASYQSHVFNIYSNTFLNTPNAMTPGNHDFANTANPVPFWTVFSHPTNGECGGLPSGNTNFYACDYANIHFISLNSVETSLMTNPIASNPLLQWLTNDLARTTQRWKIVRWHYPAFSTLFPEGIPTRTNWLPYLEQYGVDLVLWGHVHAYERSGLLSGWTNTGSFNATNKLDAGDGRETGDGPYRKNGLNGPGTVYVIAGIGGNRFETDSSGTWAYTNIGNIYGSCLLVINYNRLDFYEMTSAINGGGAVPVTNDWFTIIKSLELNVALRSPLQAGRVLPNAPVTATAAVALGTPDYTIEFYTNRGPQTPFVLAATVTTNAAGLVSAALGSWAEGEAFQVYARVVDSASPTPGTNYSTTNTVTAAYPPLAVALTSPANNADFGTTTSISVTTTVVGGTGPFVVTLYTNVNNGPFAAGPAALGSGPYSATLGPLAEGTYRVFAQVTDTAELKMTNSATNLFSVTGTGAIQVYAAGAMNTFNVLPPASKWSTYSISGGGTTYSDVSGLTAGVRSIAAGTITSALVSQTDYTQQGPARYNSSTQKIFTRPTGNAANLLMATLVNASGFDVTSLNVSYGLTIDTLTTEEIVGQQVYWSLSGEAASWTAVGLFSTAGPVSCDLNLGRWTNGGTLYLLWADDNGNSVTDGAYALDNIVFTPTLAVLGATLDAPANNQVFDPGQTITATARVVSGQAPYTVSYWTNNGAGGPFGLLATLADQTGPTVDATVGTFMVESLFDLFVEVTDATNGVARSQTNHCSVVLRPLAASLTSPSNDQSYVLGEAVHATALAHGGVAPWTVQYFLDRGSGFESNGPAQVAAPYAVDLQALDIGRYRVYALVTDSSGGGARGAVFRSPTNAFEVAETYLLRGPYLGSRGETNIVVRWRTLGTNVGRLRYGTDPASLDRFADDPDSGTNHSVTLTGLAPDRKYFYSVGTARSTLRASTNYFFKTAPPIGSSRPARFWFLSDFGWSSQGSGAVANMTNVRNAFLQYLAVHGADAADVWFTGGDNQQDSATDAQYGTDVFGYYSNLLVHTPFFPTVGNHDVGGQDYTYNWQAPTYDYFKIFHVPTNGVDGGCPSPCQSFYSYDYGEVHFIELSSQQNDLRSGADNTMLKWLTNDLQTVTTRPKPPRWLIAAWHHAPYSHGSFNSDTDANLYQTRQNFLPVLEQYGVDVVFSGHTHSYERSMLLHGSYDTPTPNPMPATNQVDGGLGRVTNGLAAGAYHKNGTLGTVYVVDAVGAVNQNNVTAHPAHVVRWQQLTGSSVIEVNSNRLDCLFLTAGGTNGDWFTLIKNVAPVMDNPSCSVVFGSNLVLLASDLLRNAADGNGDLVSLTNVAAVSTNGSAIAYDASAGTITYTPSQVGPDRFHFGLTDGYGGTNLVAVEVWVQLPDIPVVCPPVTSSNLQRLTGLYLQTVCITNSMLVPWNGFRLWVTLDANSLAHGVRVWNATGTSNGVAFLQYDQALTAGQSVTLAVEYSIPDRRTMPAPAFTVAVVPMVPPPTAVGTSMAADGIWPLSDGTIWVGFSTLSNRLYQVQYSSELGQWRTAWPVILGTGRSMSWLDTGPPKTESPPPANTNRFYRILLLP